MLKMSQVIQNTVSRCFSTFKIKNTSIVEQFRRPGSLLLNKKGQQTRLFLSGKILDINEARLK